MLNTRCVSRTHSEIARRTTPTEAERGQERAKRIQQQADRVEELGTEKKLLRERNAGLKQVLPATADDRRLTATWWR